MTCHTFVVFFFVSFMVSTASTRGGLASCCRKISDTEVEQERLASYYVQHKPSCPLKAVVFITVKDKRICSDPKKSWTKRSMEYLDEKEQHLRPPEYDQKKFN